MMAERDLAAMAEFLVVGGPNYTQHVSCLQLLQRYRVIKKQKHSLQTPVINRPTRNHGGQRYKACLQNYFLSASLYVSKRGAY